MHYFSCLFTVSRIPLPFSLEEFDLGLVYTIAKVSNEEISISDVEILKNEPFVCSENGKGIFTHKKYHLDRLVIQ
jgi:hypothetical protein